MVAGSASGLWLVTPFVALAATALVIGYEGPNLRMRFGARFRPPKIHLPGATPEKPDTWERISSYALVFVPWMVAYEAVQFMGLPADGVPSYLAFERNWPVLEWSAGVYSSVYLLVLSAPLVARTSMALRGSATSTVRDAGRSGKAM